jgi:DNA-binding MarR family transcriptional regulator
MPANFAAKSRSAKKTRPVAQPFRIGFLVHDVSRMRRTLFDQAVKPLGITRSQWWVLANLSRHEGGGMVQTELAKLLDVGKVTVGGLIDRLEASGHVERRADHEDRRAKRVYVTAKGYRLIEDMSKVGNDLNAVILDGISPERVRIAEDVLHDIKVNLKQRLNGDGGQDDADFA